MGQTVASLKLARDEAWSDILQSAPWAAFLLAGDFDARLYGIYLLQTYHYVIHNPRHQALVGTTARNQPFRYIKFCYEHAEEETGHEMMALHDLESLGVTVPEALPPPHPTTEVFIAYLYWISTQGNPLRRLGYSFWAEDSYTYIAPLIRQLKDKLHLRDQQMTFIVSHSVIDADHARAVEEIVDSFCMIEEDRDAVEEVMRTSLRLQSDMMAEVVSSYQALRAGAASPYAFLNALAPS